MTKSGIVLSVENLSKSFGAVNAITDVSFDVYEHEVVALVGDNAAGKSTIARIISGAYEQSSGVIRLCGEEVQICSAHEALELGVATVFQDLALCENLDVTANIFLGRELHDGTRLLAERRMETLAREYLDELGGRIPDIRAPLCAVRWSGSTGSHGPGSTVTSGVATRRMTATTGIPPCTPTPTWGLWSGRRTTPTGSSSATSAPRVGC